jgi:pyridoxamine 5'-phosphate oxidase
LARNAEQAEKTLTENEALDRLPHSLPNDPMHWADAWLKEATAANIRTNPNSMTIASVGPDDQPSARVVLCKNLVPDPGYLVFYTNYRSRKAQELARNPKAAALFHWDALGRQVRIEGLVVRSPEAESDEYFASRDWGSQLGAWGSDQSEPIPSKDALVRQIRERGAALGLSLSDGTQSLTDENIPPIARPAHWGGFRLWANAIELWISGTDRIHDRGRWTRDIMRTSGDKFTTTPWVGSRIQP